MQESQGMEGNIVKLKRLQDWLANKASFPRNRAIFEQEESASVGRRCCVVLMRKGRLQSPPPLTQKRVIDKGKRAWCLSS